MNEKPETLTTVEAHPTGLSAPAGSHFSVSVSALWKGGWQAGFTVGTHGFRCGPECKTFAEAQRISEDLRASLGAIANPAD